MRYFAVTCVLGHNASTQKNKRACTTFSITAPNMMKAIDKARKMPGVKHNHPEAVLKAQEISHTTFLENRKVSAYQNVWA